MAKSDRSDRNGTEEVQKAVALAGEAERDPKRTKVVAVGRGAVAEQMLQIAFAHDVKVREDADLVEVLEAVEIDSEIPVDAIAAVAEILAYLYRANGSAPPEADFTNAPGNAMGRAT